MLKLSFKPTLYAPFYTRAFSTSKPVCLFTNDFP
jgi:peptide chain release factor 1